MGSPHQHAVVQLAVDALRRLAAAPPVAQSARAAAQEIERAAAVTPFEAALGGNDAARADLIDFLVGNQLLRGVRRGRTAPLLRVQRGASTRVVARQADGSIVELAMVSADAPAAEEATAALRARTDELRAETAARESAHEGAELALPGPLRVRPPRWNVFLWLARAVMGFFLRRKRAAADDTRAALVESRRRLTAATEEADELATRTQGARDRFTSQVRALIDGSTGASEVLLELGAGPLPVGVVLLDAPDGARAPEGHEPDAVVALGDGVARASAPGGHMAQLFDQPRELCVALPGLAVASRALRLGRRAQGTLTAGVAALDAALARAEVGYASRIERLEALRVEDPTAYTASRVELLRTAIIERCHGIIEHAGGELGAELERLAQAWTAAISGAASTDALREAGARVDDESAEQVNAARASVERRIVSGLSGGAHDLEPQLLADLRERSAEAQREVVAAPAPVLREILPSLSGDKAGLAMGRAAPWLVALFRSTESLRADAVEKVKSRADRLRQIAAAELLDAEPLLREALEASLTWSLTAALERHASWLAAALDAERSAIARERDALSPLVELRDNARRDVQRLTEELSHLEGTAAA
ncbi:MAG TPA: hypothetical protein VMZ28_00440 [Kofleriaceae bacterium]|nr:hypothetical protein [Kofleriaceae bacterium]